jgi:hypothetical protein
MPGLFLRQINQHIPIPKTDLKPLQPIGYDDFLVGYRNGRLGCVVDVIRIVRLFYSGRIREKRVSTVIVAWSFGLLAMIGLSIAGLSVVPLLWVIPTAAVAVALFLLAGVHAISGVVLKAVLADGEFYRLVAMERALRLAADGEGNLPRSEKVVPMRDSRRVQR